MKLKKGKFEGVGYETEGMDSINEGVENGVLPSDRKGYSLSNPTSVNYVNKRSTRIPMGWNNLIVGSN